MECEKSSITCFNQTFYVRRIFKTNRPIINFNVKVCLNIDCILYVYTVLQNPFQWVK